MPDVVQVGPFLLKMQWLVGIGSLLVGYLVIRYRLKVAGPNAAGYRDERVIQTIENSALLALVVWKFSVAIFDPASIWANPMALLYYTGGAQGVWLAAVAALIYFYLRARRERVSVWVYGELVAVGLLAATAIYHLISLFWYHQGVQSDVLQIVTALTILLLAFFRSGKEVGDALNLDQAVLWFSLAQVGIAFLDPRRPRYWRGFSREQVLYIGLSALTLGIEWAAERRRLGRNV